MGPIEKIVVGTDFSDASEHALEVALDLAQRVGASVDLVHAYGLPSFTLPLEGALMPSASHTTELSARFQDLLDAAVARHAARGVPLRGHLRTGVAHEELWGFAREIGADLIVIGSHGRSGAAHMLLGSVAERVLRVAGCAVLTVPG